MILGISGYSNGLSSAAAKRPMMPATHDQEQEVPPFYVVLSLAEAETLRYVISRMPS